MTKIGWKDLIEGIGMSAIIASLLFVGLQLRQAQEIATAEGYLEILSIRNEIGNSIKAEVSVWNKGLSGVDLSRDEAVVFAVLINQINDSRHYEYIQTVEISGEESAIPVVHDFAIFLYNNPVAKSVWLAREDYLINSRSKIDLDGETFSWWKEAVMSDLTILEEKAVPVRKASFVDW
jgi:hypothetical protein